MMFVGLRPPLPQCAGGVAKHGPTVQSLGVPHDGSEKPGARRLFGHERNVRGAAQIVNRKLDLRGLR